MWEAWVLWTQDSRLSRPPSNAKESLLLNGNTSAIPFAAASNGRPGMIQNWSLEIQHQLAPDLILTVGYIGNHATRLNSNLQQLNAIDPKFLPLGNNLSPMSQPGYDDLPRRGVAGRATLAGVGVTTVPAWFTTLWGPTGQDLVWPVTTAFPPILSGNAGGTGITTNCCLENLGQSTYNALEVKMERRFRNGLNLLAFLHLLEDVDRRGQRVRGAHGFQQFRYLPCSKPANLKAEKALSYQDVPHAFVLSYLYELPVGKGKKFLNKGGVTDKVLGGWQIGGVHRYQKGVCHSSLCTRPDKSVWNGESPFEPHSGSAVCLLPTTRPTTPCRAAVAARPNDDGTFTASGTNSFFNCAAFFDPNAPGVVATNGFSFGDLPKSTWGGPEFRLYQ